MVVGLFCEELCRIIIFFSFKEFWIRRCLFSDVDAYVFGNGIWIDG